MGFSGFCVLASPGDCFWDLTYVSGLALPPQNRLLKTNEDGNLEERERKEKEESARRKKKEERGVMGNETFAKCPTGAWISFFSSYDFSYTQADHVPCL